MAYITQEYEINGDTTLSTWEQLSNASEIHGLGYNESWKWDGRTLSCFVDENGQFIELNGTKKFNSSAAQISGIWILNKTEKPIKIYAVGDSGQIDVRVTEYTTFRPLADDGHPYIASQQFTINHGELSSVEIYMQIPQIGDDGHGSLSIEISGVAGTSIRTIKLANGYSVDGKSGINLISCGNWDEGGWGINVNDHQDMSTEFAWPGISVDITENGTLTYIPNKNTLNPNHLDLNN